MVEQFEIFKGFDTDFEKDIKKWSEIAINPTPYKLAFPGKFFILFTLI